jgi:hypothetical protein
MQKLLFISGLTTFVLVPALTLADVGPPAHMQITEREEGLYSVQWRVPKALPARAVPEPDFPETCRPVGERSVVDSRGAWLIEQEYRGDVGLPGQVVGMDYPFPDLALTTVVRVELLSGDRFAHVLSPGEGPWRLPEGTAAPDPLRDARRAVLAGLAHVLGSWVHLVFLVVLALLGGLSPPLRLVGLFTLSQVLSVLLMAVLSVELPGVPVEIGFAVAVALLARQTMRPEEERRRLLALVVVAGFVHGLGIASFLTDSLGDLSSSLLVQVLAILGIDVAHLLGVVIVAAVWVLVARSSGPPRRTVSYGAGAMAVALALGLAVTGGEAETQGSASSIALPQGLQGSPGATSGAAGSRRLAPAAPDAPIQSFLAVEPFEVRHEVMLRLSGVAELLALDPASVLDVSSQASISRRLSELVLNGTVVQVDGKSPPATVRRADFMIVDPTGALPRVNPVPEKVSDAVVGVIVVYPTAGMADKVSLTWSPFPESSSSVPVTVIDPEAVDSSTLSAEEASVLWENALLEDPIPRIAAVPVEPSEFPIPWMSLPFLVLAPILLVSGVRGYRPALSVAMVRVVLALALVAGPIVQTAVALPGSTGRVPSERQARRILAGLLPNVYRALEFNEETLIYDRLAVSVTGETLSEVYLEQRRALEMEERGGAKARVEAVEVLEATEIEPGDRGFGVRSTWTVGGMVTHFGHRHFRQNRYDARVGIVPVDGTWKIQSIEVFDQERIK